MHYTAVMAELASLTEGPTRAIAVRFPVAMLDEIKRRADSERRKQAAWIRIAVEQQLRLSAGGAVLIEPRELDVLLAVATLHVGAPDDSEPMVLPGRVQLQDVGAVIARYGQRYLR